MRLLHSDSLAADHLGVIDGQSESESEYDFTAELTGTRDRCEYDIECYYT